MFCLVRLYSCLSNEGPNDKPKKHSEAMTNWAVDHNALLCNVNCPNGKSHERAQINFKLLKNTK